MNRRNFLKSAAAIGFASALPTFPADKLSASSVAGQPQAGKDQPVAPANPLTPPAKGGIPVAFPISKGAQVIDFCGPWEVLQDVQIPGREEAAFQLYTVAATLNHYRLKPVGCGGTKSPCG